MKVTTLPVSSDTAQLPVFSIALISCAALSYEVLLIRLFSIIQWHHFAYMIISLALLGYGVSGTFLTINFERFSANFSKVFLANIFLFSVSCISCFMLAQTIPFNAQEILWDSNQIIYVMLLYIILALPFFFVANVIGLSLLHYKVHISRLYAADMLGAGFGAIAVVSCLMIFFPEDTLRFISSLGFAAIIVAGWELKLSDKIKWYILPLIVFPLFIPDSWVTLNLSPYKSLSQTLNIDGTKIITQRSGPLGLLSVAENHKIPFRHMPGLSMKAKTEPPPQLAVFTDGDSISIINKLDEQATIVPKQANLDFLGQVTSASPYYINTPEKVLILGSGGGTGILQALYHGAGNVDAVEINAQLVVLMQRDFAHYSGNLYNNPRVTVHIDEARGFITKTQELYDLIQVSLLDSFAASTAGLYALNESYLYTLEALKNNLRKLTPTGMLSITRWVELPPRSSLKLFSTMVEALESSGYKAAGQHLILIRSWQTSTLLVKRLPFTDNEISHLLVFCEKYAFDVAYFPGISKSQVNRYNKLRQPIFYQATQSLLSDNKKEYMDDYKFDIRPATDNKPYFFNFFKWSSLPEIVDMMGKGGMALVEWGYLILVATLLQATIISLILIILPLLLHYKSKSSTKRSFPIPVLVYFSALGLAFLFLEIAFIQKFILFLYHPTYAVVVVLASFLLFSGLGSKFSGKFAHRNEHRKGIVYAVIGISVLSLLYVLLLEPLFSLFLFLPSWIKIGCSIVLIAPVAFCMGMPFPLGLSLLETRSGHLIPWAWAINGCASVISAVLATLMAIHFGFIIVILMALSFYLLAGIFIAPIMGKANASPAGNSV